MRGNDKDFSGGMSDSGLERLQRTLRWVSEKPPSQPDPMLNKPMLATRHCPCDDCAWKARCLAGCRAFDRWVERGPGKRRTYQRRTQP